MEDREMPRMRKYGESKTTRIMMATVSHVTSGSGLIKFQADGFLSDRVYSSLHASQRSLTAAWHYRQDALLDIGLHTEGRKSKYLLQTWWQLRTTWKSPLYVLSLYCYIQSLHYDL